MIDEKVKMYLEEAYEVAKNTILEHKETMEKIAELLIKKEYISGEDFSMMVDNPDKIDEFRDTDEIITKAEESEKSEVKEIINKVEEKLKSVRKPKTAEPKKSDKKVTSRKKA